MPETVKTSENVNTPNRAAGSLLTAYVIGLVAGGDRSPVVCPEVRQ